MNHPAYEHYWRDSSVAYVAYHALHNRPSLPRSRCTPSTRRCYDSSAADRFVPNAAGYAAGCLPFAHRTPPTHLPRRATACAYHTHRGAMYERNSTLFFGGCSCASLRARTNGGRVTFCRDWRLSVGALTQLLFSVYGSGAVAVYACAGVCISPTFFNILAANALVYRSVTQTTARPFFS